MSGIIAYIVGLVHLVSSHIMAFCVRADEIMANITRYFKQLASLVAIVCSKNWAQEDEARHREANPKYENVPHIFRERAFEICNPVQSAEDY